MKLTKFNHRQELFPRGMFNFLDEVFGDDFLPTLDTDSKWVPAVNVTENEDGYSIEVAAPGLDKKDFNVSLDKNIIAIEARKESKETNKDQRFTRREFNYTTFKRNFSIPETVNMDKINAEYSDGILKIELPKVEEAKQKLNRMIKIS